MQDITKSDKKMIRSYLWSQAADNISNDIYVINGVMSCNPQSNEQQQASKLIFEGRSWELLHKSIIGSLKKKQLLHNNVYISYKKGKGFYISSNYLEKDVIGRRIAFQFFCETDNIDVAVEELKKASQVIDKTCDAKELERLVRIARHKDNRFYKWIIVVVILSLLYLLIKNLGK